MLFSYGRLDEPNLLWGKYVSFEHFLQLIENTKLRMTIISENDSLLLKFRNFPIKPKQKDFLHIEFYDFKQEYLVRLNTISEQSDIVLFHISTTRSCQLKYNEINQILQALSKNLRAGEYNDVDYIFEIFPKYFMVRMLPDYISIQNATQVIVYLFGIHKLNKIHIRLLCSDPNLRKSCLLIFRVCLPENYDIQYLDGILTVIDEINCFNWE